eukprot:1774398-Rhodomonas_salina.1
MGLHGTEVYGASSQLPAHVRCDAMRCVLLTWRMLLRVFMDQGTDAAYVATRLAGSSSAPTRPKSLPKVASRLPAKTKHCLAGIIYYKGKLLRDQEKALLPPPTGGELQELDL